MEGASALFSIQRRTVQPRIGRTPFRRTAEFPIPFLEAVLGRRSASTGGFWLDRIGLRWGFRIKHCEGKYTVTIVGTDTSSSSIAASTTMTLTVD